MRKLIVGEWISVDGFVADENGGADFFASKEWSAGSDDDVLKLMDGIDAILLGANTYHLFLEYWPSATTDTELIANKLNQTKKIVFSHSITSVEWGRWEAPELVSGSAEEAIKKMKQQSGKDMILWGSISLFQSLFRAGLVDELHLRIVPVVLGKGRPLFAEGNAVKMESKHAKHYGSGLLLNELVVCK